MLKPYVLAFARAPVSAFWENSASAPTSAMVFGAGDFEEAFRDVVLGVGSERGAVEIARIVEGVVHGKREQHHHQLLAFHDLRHGGDDQVGRRAHQQVDLVDVEQLGVDAGHRRRVGLVIVVDELHRPAEQAALGVELLDEDLLGEQMRLARRGEATGQRHRKSDLDRVGRLRREAPRQRGGGEALQQPPAMKGKLFRRVDHDVLPVM
jgi:hypothetical protein